MEPQALAMDVRQLEKLSVLQDEQAPNLVAEMAQGFLARTPARLARLRECLLEGNAARLANEAHGLATSSGMFGMMRVRLLCKSLENLVRGSGLEGAEALILQVERAFTEARPLLLAQLQCPEVQSPE
ncbi:Hpt domain-containing protein [Melittangium boletus]|uniref:Hpt domain-containing protein n=1 Tax=Melittangium boletus TaxID=83453 RepID=UPI003DA3D081